MRAEGPLAPRIGPSASDLHAAGDDGTWLRDTDRLAAIFAHAGIGIAEVDAEGRLRRVNSHLAALRGSSPEALLGERRIEDRAAEESLGR